MKRILITGATGNIGREIIPFLCELNLQEKIEVVAAVRTMETAKKELAHFPNLSFTWFDFENPSSFITAFQDVDLLFLLRPPQISNVDKIFKPLLESAKENQIKKVIFLSVQGAELSKVIPHNKIERLIKSMDFNFIFVRPSYFMQNLTTTLLPEITKNQCISLPSGSAKFNWIDVKNIGECTALLCNAFEDHQNSAIEITGSENKSFKEVTDLLSSVTGKTFIYQKMNPFSYYFMKRKNGIESGFAFVMTLLHFLPRFQKEPTISTNFERLTGKSPTTLKEFIHRNKETFLNE